MYMQYHKSHHFPAVINLHCKCWSSNMWHPISITFLIYYLFAVEPTLLKVWYYISTKCDSFGSSMETLCQIWHLVPKNSQFTIIFLHQVGICVTSGEEEHRFHGCMLVFLLDTTAVCCQLRWRLQRECISLPKSASPAWFCLKNCEARCTCA